MPSDPLDSSNAIWDDGEWISWEDIDRYLVDSGQIEPSEVEDDYEQEPHRTTQEKLDELELKVNEAKELLRRGLREQINFGEMGELYAEIRYGMTRQRPYAQGSDGRVGNDFYEVKTITPWKTKPRATAKRRGHFNILIVVKISEHFMFDARRIPRAKLSKGRGGKKLSVSWTSLPKLNEPC